MIGTAGSVQRPKPLGHNALAAELAGVMEHDRALDVKVPIEGDGRVLVVD
jgi:hypothetical protein